MSSTETDSEPAAAGDCDHSGARPGARFCSRCGADRTAVPETWADEDTDDGPWWRRWWRRESEAGWARSPVRLPARLVLPIAFGAAVIVAAVTVLYFVQGRWYEPEAAARELFDALEAGDGPAVAELLGVEVDAHPLLAPGALDTGYEAPTGFEVVSVEHDVKGEWVSGWNGAPTLDYVEDHTKRPDREHARVTIAYRLGGQEHTAELDATREASGWFRAWSINPATLETTVTAYATAAGPVGLAGVTVPEADAGNDDGYAEAPAGLLAIPGIYTATADGDALWPEASATVAVPLGAEESVVVSAEMRPEAIEEVTAQVHSHIDECIASPGYPDSLCGFEDTSVWMLTMPDDAVWELESYPEIEVTPDHAGGLEIRTLTPGSAVTEYTTITGNDRTIRADINANGYATIEGDSIAFDPRACDLDTGIC